MDGYDVSCGNPGEKTVVESKIFASHVSRQRIAMGSVYSGSPGHARRFSEHEKTFEHAGFLMHRLLHLFLPFETDSDGVTGS